VFKEQLIPANKSAYGNTMPSGGRVFFSPPARFLTIAREFYNSGKQVSPQYALLRHRATTIKTQTLSNNVRQSKLAEDRDYKSPR